MRKSVFLTLLIALFSVSAAWAEFNPTPGVKYALQEKTSGLYLDILTLGITDPGFNTNNISLSSAPCAIYFEAHDEWTWYMKNIKGQYVNTENYAWNPEIGDTKKNWFIVEIDNYVKIHSWNDSYIVGNTETGKPLYCNNQDTPLQFSLVEFVEQTQSYTFYIIDAPQGVNVTYNGQAITGGATIEGTFDRDLFAAEDIEGYTWDVEVDEANKTVTLVYTEVVEGGDELNGYYHISHNGNPLFIHYYAGEDSWNKEEWTYGYKLLSGKDGFEGSAGDMIFAITPSNGGYTLSTQGMYLGRTSLTTWQHVLFTEQEAGTYVFNQVNDLWNICCADGWNGVSYLTNWSGIFGNDTEDNASSFTLTPATTYAVAEGMTALYLPFNVVLPEGVVAYDVVNEDALESGENLFVELAVAGDILKAGTPVILDAEEATSLTITTNSSGAKGAKPGSLLRGSFVKYTLGVGTSKKFILDDGRFEPVTVTTEMPANSCWVVTGIEDENANIEPGHIMIDGWEFTYTENENRITLDSCVSEGDPDLTIGPRYFVNGVEKVVVAISPKFLHGNTTLESVTIPATMTNLGFREIEPMFEGRYEGQEGDFATYVEGVTPPQVLDSAGMHRCFVFPKDPDTGKPYVVGKDFAWKLTLDVTIDVPEGGEHPSFNPWGSAVVSTKPNSLDDNYQGYMQIYLWKDLQHIVVKIDNADDRYASSIPDETGNLYVNKNFTFELEHDGAGGYQAVVYFGNGKAKMFNITATKDNMVGDFDRLYYSLPKGIHVDVKFEKLTSYGMFVGCTNLKEIIVDPANTVFKGCEHGVLYDKNGFYVMRIPEGKHDHHFDIPSKVVRLYPGAIHGVNADIVLHSNPEIGVVEGHEHAVENARFFLSLDDKDTSIKEGETGYGGARDFTSANNNTYVAANYKRAPLAKGKYGTIVLPFVATNWKNKYDFFEMTEANATSFHFSPVDELEDQKAYLYKLKDGIEPDGKEMEMENGLDVFKTEEGAAPFTVRTHAKYNPNDEKPGGFRALGAYVNHYIETINYPNSAYYYFNIDSQKFIKVTRKLNYRPYRAIFVVTPEKEGEAAKAPARLGLRIGGTTEVDPSPVEGLEEPVYYDLQGRRVENPTQGIYIVNGKKVVVK